MALAAAVLAGLLVTTGPGSGPAEGRPSNWRPDRSRGFVDAGYARDRQDEYLRFATQRLEPGSALNVLAHGERARRDPSFRWDSNLVTPASFAASFAKLDTFADTADFDLLYLMNLWYGYRDQLRRDTVAAIERRIIEFKYWYDEPTPPGMIDQRWYWSENHRIIFHTLEYLAGQAFPRAVFSNDGRTGAQHRRHAARLIGEWLDEKARYGFVEWHSDVYYQKDVTPLLSLVEWADDPALRERAAGVLDLFLYDIALHVQKGTSGATHGRSYMKDKSTALDQDVFGLSKLLFDDTTEPYQSAGDPGAALLARARRYRLPEVIRRVARSRATGVDRERMNVPLDPNAPVDPDAEAPFGFDFDDPENVDFWFDRNALTTWQVVGLTLETADRYGLWETDFFKPFAGFRDLIAGDIDLARELAQSLAPMIAFGLLAQVNTYTWRSPDAMLSSAQDYRAGAFGEQYHAWQATLDDALVFTTHPKNEPQIGTQWPDSDGYWTGTGSMPRSAQHRTAAIHQYAPSFANPGPGLLEDFSYLDYTHAYFPTEKFDRVVRDGNWTLGKRGDGYVALWSWRPVRWREHDPDEVFTHGLTEPFDLVADGGADNAWVVEVGDPRRYGSFAAFRRAVTSADVSAEPLPRRDDGLAGGFDVQYESPGAGRLRLGWEGPFRVDGRRVALDGYPRHDNRWSRTPFLADQVTVADGPWRLELDLAEGTRTVRGPRRA